jgi:hypothetical protein
MHLVYLTANSGDISPLSFDMWSVIFAMESITLPLTFVTHTTNFDISPFNFVSREGYCHNYTGKCHLL